MKDKKKLDSISKLIALSKSKTKSVIFINEDYHLENIKAEQKARVVRCLVPKGVKIDKSTHRTHNINLINNVISYEGSSSMWYSFTFEDNNQALEFWNQYLKSNENLV
jgi:hypothetical protein